MSASQVISQHLRAAHVPEVSSDDPLFPLRAQYRPLKETLLTRAFHVDDGGSPDLVEPRLPTFFPHEGRALTRQRRVPGAARWAACNASSVPTANDMERLRVAVERLTTSWIRSSAGSHRPRRRSVPSPIRCCWRATSKTPCGATGPRWRRGSPTRRQPRRWTM